MVVRSLAGRAGPRRCCVHGEQARKVCSVNDQIEHLRAVPIGDYGFLSDGEVCALLAPGGSVDWMCVPRFDSGSVFGRMLGPHAGSFRISPVDVEVPADRPLPAGHDDRGDQLGYGHGWIVVRDALLMGPWRHESTRSKTHRRTPNDYDAEHILLRTVRCVSGEVQMVMDCEPVFDYGRRTAAWAYTEHGYHQGRATADGVDFDDDPDHRSAVGLRGRPGQRPDPAQGG